MAEHILRSIEKSNYVEDAVVKEGKTKLVDILIEAGRKHSGIILKTLNKDRMVTTVYYLGSQNIRYEETHLLQKSKGSPVEHEMYFGDFVGSLDIDEMRTVLRNLKYLGF